MALFVFGFQEVFHLLRVTQNAVEKVHLLLLYRVDRVRNVGQLAELIVANLIQQVVL